MGGKAEKKAGDGEVETGGWSYETKHSWTCRKLTIEICVGTGADSQIELPVGSESSGGGVEEWDFLRIFGVFLLQPCH